MTQLGGIHVSKTHLLPVDTNVTKKQNLFSRMYFRTQQTMVTFVVICFSFLVDFSQSLAITSSRNQYDDHSNTYFTYEPLEFENCKKASECELVNEIVHEETIDNLSVCTLDETITSPPCPLPKENVCVCVKDVDCQEIYDRFTSQDQSLIRTVRSDFRSCGFENGAPKYCCPYKPNKTQDPVPPKNSHTGRNHGNDVS